MQTRPFKSIALFWKLQPTPATCGLFITPTFVVFIKATYILLSGPNCRDVVNEEKSFSLTVNRDVLIGLAVKSNCKIQPLFVAYKMLLSIENSNP